MHFILLIADRKRKLDLRQYFAWRVKATIPDACGAEYDVPCNWLSLQSESGERDV